MPLDRRLVTLVREAAYNLYTKQDADRVREMAKELLPLVAPVVTAGARCGVRLGTLLDEARSYQLEANVQHDSKCLARASHYQNLAISRLLEVVNHLANLSGED